MEVGAGFAVKHYKKHYTKRLNPLTCDLTQFSAASAPMILLCETTFKHEVGNKKEDILRPLSPYRCRELKKEV